MMTKKKKSKSREVHPDAPRSRIGRRLSYLLRFGAVKEGLSVIGGGYVDFGQLMKLPLMKHHTIRRVLEEVDTSVSKRGRRRFERKFESGNIYVRVMHGKRIEPRTLDNRSTNNTKVPSLVETTLTYVCDNIKLYDLEHILEGTFLSALLERLKSEKRLTNKTLRCLLGPGLESLDLEGVVLNEWTLKLMVQRCTHLRVLSLRENGYVVTDHVMEHILKNLKKLESLDLTGCKHLTDRTLRTICEYKSSSLVNLLISGVPDLSQDAILKLVESCTKLKHLDIFGNSNITDKGWERLKVIGRRQNLSVVLRK